MPRSHHRLNLLNNRDPYLTTGELQVHRSHSRPNLHNSRDPYQEDLHHQVDSLVPDYLLLPVEDLLHLLNLSKEEFLTMLAMH